MLEIDCRKCTNLAETCDRCMLYGSDPKKAAEACRADMFKNYYPKRTPDEFTPGMAVWCVERNAADDLPVSVTGYMFLAKVQAAVIVSVYIDSVHASLDDILIAHYEQTKIENETGLCVFPACDCYPTQTQALEALAAESED